MSMPIVTREEAEAYAIEHSITLQEAKEELEFNPKLRLRPAPGYHMVFDQDGFYIGMAKD